MFLPARELVVADLAADIARQRNRRAVLLEMHEHRLQKLARSDWGADRVIAFVDDVPMAHADCRAVAVGEVRH